MAREKVGNRISPVTRGGRAGSAWDRTFLGDNRYGPDSSQDTPVRSFIPNRGSFGDSAALRQQSNLAEDPFIVNAIQLAERGDDRPLLPYQPTPTINPGRPRTLAAGYDERSQTLRIKFREGEIYRYFKVPPSVWWQFQRAQSPGRFINTKLNNYPYLRGAE